MASIVVPLPREPDTLIGMIVELRDENDKLRAMLETLRRKLFGAQSERLGTDPGQLALDLEDVSTAPVEFEPESAKPQPQDRRGRRKAARNIGSLPKHLPRDDVFIEPETKSCPCYQGALHRIGEDVSEMLDIVPAIIRVKRIHRPRYGCRVCESAVVQAPAPPRPLDGGLPTTALLAHIAAGKFAWHLPLHRQTQMLAAYGIDLDRSTLVHWIGRTAWWLRPLYALLTETVMAAGKVFCDDTPLPVLDRTRRRTRTARLWCYAVDDRPWQSPAPPAVIYRYAEDRRGRHIKEHLDGFHGVLQVDGYNGYDGLARPDRPGGPITLAYCWVHARREFFDVHKQTKDPVAAEALRRIGEIYVIEARIRGRPAEERVAIRQAETKPLMMALWSWLMQRLEETSAKSSLALAIRYTLGHWEGLTVFLTDGRVEVGRVDDWRGGCRSRGVAVSGGFRLMPVPHCRRTVTPFPVAARQTGHADFPHPAFSRPVRPSLSAGRRAAAGRYRGRVPHRDTRPGSGGTRRLVVPFAASTSGELAAQCMRGCRTVASLSEREEHRREAS